MFCKKKNKSSSLLRVSEKDIEEESAPSKNDSETPPSIVAKSKESNSENITKLENVGNPEESTSGNKVVPEVLKPEKKPPTTVNISIAPIPPKEPTVSPSDDKEEQATRRRTGLRGEEINLNVEIKTFSKTKQEEQLISQALQKNEFLKHALNDNEIQQIIEAMSPLDVKASDMIIKQGEDGKYMYVSISGKYEIIIDDKPYDQFEDNRVFGELAILYNKPRFATIRAVTECRAWMLDRNNYRQILQRSALAEEEQTVMFLKKTSTLENAPHKKLEILANLLNNKYYKADTIVVKQGDKGDNFYIIKSGTATVTIEGKGVVATLTSGQYFGERALLEEDCRQATVTANSPGIECLVLSRLDFHKYLGGDLRKFLAKEDVQKRKSSVELKKYSSACFEDITILKTIGVGGFGRVELVRYKSDVVAVKVLKKHTILKNGQKEQAFNEKNIQMSCNSAFIVSLYRTFQDKRYLYYLMECCLGGDLFGLMLQQRNRCFDEHGARFLAGCILEAFAYLHERDIAYLDLKPENVLISTRGYAKLSDFGNAVCLPDNKRTFVFAGTPEYVAPEIIYERGHDKMADYWAFGIFIYELLVGKTPFRSSDPTYMKTYTLILKGIDEVIFPARVSQNAERIIKKLCRPNRIRRLGCLKNGVEDVRKHKWFAGLNWDSLVRQDIESPFIPTLDGPTDSKYFDNFRKDADVPPEYEIWDQF